MKQAGYLWSLVGLCMLMIIFLMIKTFVLGREVEALRSQSRAESTVLKESLERAQTELRAAKQPAPGLGEYMTTIQLHAGKLWFAAKAANWGLAGYELDELKETMEAAKALNAEKNGVKISDVLDAVLQTQIVQLGDSIKHRNASEFQQSYDDTLSACNGCHAAAGFKFIHIVRPSAPPVTNQKWEVSPRP